MKATSDNLKPLQCCCGSYHTLECVSVSAGDSVVRCDATGNVEFLTAPGARAGLGVVVRSFCSQCGVIREYEFTQPQYMLLAGEREQAPAGIHYDRLKRAN